MVVLIFTVTSVFAQAAMDICQILYLSLDEAQDDDSQVGLINAVTIALLLDLGHSGVWRQITSNN